MLDFAIYDDYGLIYQLEKGMLSDRVWFECSLAYQLYALQNFYGFERFAIHTDHSQIAHPNYKKMVKTALAFLQPDDKYPLMNDSRALDGEKKVVKAGDTMLKVDSVPHGCVCLKKGVLLDVFNPMRKDFV